MKNKAKISAYYALNINEYNMRAHVHDRYEIMYTARGECNILIGNEVIVLKQRQSILIYPNVSHELKITNQTNCSLLNIEWEHNGGDIDLSHARNKSADIANFLKEKFEYKILYDKGGLEFACKDLINAIEKKDNDIYMRELLFSKFLMEMLRAQSTKLHNNSVNYINKAKKYIEENFFHDISVEDIARHTRISKYYLQSLFTKYLDCNIVKYINDMRINQACFLLKNSDLSIQDIAFEVGFNSRQHFAYTFEKREKISPYKYKKIYGHTLSANTKTFKIIESD